MLGLTSWVSFPRDLIFNRFISNLSIAWSSVVRGRLSWGGPGQSSQQKAVLQRRATPVLPGFWASVCAPECVWRPATPSSCQLRDDCIALRILTLSSFFFPFPSPPHPFRPPSPPQGLSHLMMSEQGRCLVLATLQPPRIACLRASGWPLGVSLLLAGRLLPVPPAVGRAGSRPPWGGGVPFPMHLGFLSPSSLWLVHSAPPFVIPGTGPAGLPPREKHETRHDGVDNGGEWS